MPWCSNLGFVGEGEREREMLGGSQSKNETEERQGNEKKNKKKRKQAPRNKKNNIIFTIGD